MCRGRGTQRLVLEHVSGVLRVANRSEHTRHVFVRQLTGKTVGAEHQAVTGAGGQNPEVRLPVVAGTEGAGNHVAARVGQRLQGVIWPSSTRYCTSEWSLVTCSSEADPSEPGSFSMAEW